MSELNIRKVRLKFLKRYLVMSPDAKKIFTPGEIKIALDMVLEYQEIEAEKIKELETN